ncbi:MAG: HNH endonuclease [Acidobacteria bacterium]|nr:HNH endonuclease [Acidobacteriota bacterium]
MRYWWVNQNQTYEEETRGNFMWSPKTNKGDRRNPFYDTMLEVAPGDIVFSFIGTYIRSIGIVTGKAQTAPQPDFRNAGLNWSKVGWFVPVYYCAVSSPIRPKDHIDALRPFLPRKYSPLQDSGNGLQQVYLAAVPEALANALIGLMGARYHDALAAITGFPTSPDDEEIAVPDEGLGEAPATEKEQLIRARRGQGLFRSHVLLIEGECRVTKVSDSKHLRASHIKPWKNSDDLERLKGDNGLLLSPHIDHLFDQGYISFSADRRLLIVPEVRVELLDKWHIDESVNVGEFNREQRAFLDYHQVNVFSKAHRGQSTDPPEAEGTAAGKI